MDRAQSDSSFFHVVYHTATQMQEPPRSLCACTRCRIVHWTLRDASHALCPECRATKRPRRALSLAVASSASKRPRPAVASSPAASTRAVAEPASAGRTPPVSEEPDRPTALPPPAPPPPLPLPPPPAPAPAPAPEEVAATTPAVTTAAGEQQCDGAAGVAQPSAVIDGASSNAVDAEHDDDDASACPICGASLGSLGLLDREVGSIDGAFHTGLSPLYHYE